MNIPHEFYEDEIRCDFLITSMVKRTWAAQMEILADLDEACRKNGFEYFAEWGTLLGTVRHAGFIPWDDDMDICMKRKDYELFTNNVSAYLPDNYSIVNYKSSRDFKQMLSRIVNSDHYRFDPEFMKKFSGLPFAMGIDIFPLDFMTDDEEYEREREERINLVYGVANDIALYDIPLSSLENELKEIEAKCHAKIDRKSDVLTQLRILLEKLFGEVDEKDAKYITLFPLWLNHHTYRFPVEYYKNSISMPFENMHIEVPVCYDSILKHKYGAGYMKQVRSGGAHEYPYYANHLDVLKEHFGYEWPTYKFRPEELNTGRNTGNAGATDDKGSVLFISYNPWAFENMRSVVHKYSDDGYRITILPIIRFDIAPDMSSVNQRYDDVPDDYYSEGYENVSVTHDESVLDTHPDIIVTNYPYDEYNLITAVDKKYYAGALRGKTDRLIYVPPFEAKSVKPEDERAKKLMPTYVCTPMTAMCDEIILHSEEMKERYVECLCAFSDDNYRDRWEGKIKIIPPMTAGTEEKAALPKHKIMFYVGIAAFAAYKSEAVKKIKSVFDIFEENRDRTDVIYIMQEGLTENLKTLFPDVFSEYEAYDFREYSEDISIDEIDAYYGEPSVYATELMNMGRPCMIWNVEI